MAPLWTGYTALSPSPAPLIAGSSMLPSSTPSGVTNCPQKKQWGGQGVNRGRARAVRENSDEETPPSLHSRAQHPDNNPEPSSRTSEPVSDEELPSYGRVESAHNRIRNILTTLPTDQRSEVASRLERDF